MEYGIWVSTNKIAITLYELYRLGPRLPLLTPVNGAYSDSSAWLENIRSHCLIEGARASRRPTAGYAAAAFVSPVAVP